jgi:ABC-type dipeptide/oligopeptide/nickel transport system permease component
VLRYVLGRLLRLVLTLFAVSIVTYVLLSLIPGSFDQLADVEGSGLGGGGGGELGEAAPVADRPFFQGYVDLMVGVVTGNIGPSYKYPQATVESIIASAFPVSLSLAIGATLLTVAVAVPLGVLAAVRKDRPADYVPMFLLTTAHAFPGYLAALVLVLIFSSWLGVLPTSGWSGPQNAIIPIIALAVGPTAMLARYVRSSMLESLREEYVTAAYAKGGKPRIVLVKHALRNSLIPVVTVVGPLFAGLATGTVFIEALMGIPGLGMFFTVAARTRDVPLLMGTTLFFALILVLTNFLVDVLYGVIDPRIRHAGPLTSVRRRFGFRGAATPTRPIDFVKEASG